MTFEDEGQNRSYFSCEIFQCAWQYALYGFRFSSSCSTPGTVTVIFCICGYGLSPMSGKGSLVIGLKADLN